MSDAFLKRPRIQSIDLLRGLVMILMTLDHTRDYFHHDAFFYDPLDLTQTTPLIFLTRFVTHFCAPVFVFLAGTSAYFTGQRKTKKELSNWLIKRGLWLIVVELTIIKLAWNFKLDYNIIVVQVIWALGAGMITLAGFIHLRKYLALSIAFAMIAGHNLLDGFHPGGSVGIKTLWNILHEFGGTNLGPVRFFVAYPVIPWLGVMLTGYYFGELYRKEYDPRRRQKVLLYLGLGMIVLFTLLRSGNFYGDPAPWKVQKNFIYSFLSFFNVTKYPPSLQYLLITIGPSIVLLSITEKLNLNRLKPVVIIGRVPMFWYIVHIYLIHLTAAIAAMLTGYSFSDMIIDFWVSYQPGLKGYGFNIWGVYLFWAGICLFLYPIAYWYNEYKSSNRDKWWLTYL